MMSQVLRGAVDVGVSGGAGTVTVVSSRWDWSEAIEITDLLLAVDPLTGERLPVVADDVERRLVEIGDRWGAAIVRRLRRNGAVLDAAGVDQLFVAVHSELSRLGQEFAQPARLMALLGLIVDEISERLGEPIRVVDVGCGVGYTTRWLARHAGFGAGVELIGSDLNPVLVEEATRLAALDGVDCTFVVGDALRLEHPATVVTSSNLLHHLRGPALAEFFAAHAAESTRAFVHYDVTPSHHWLRFVGAWVFHMARMRLAISRHDGVVSAMRAHDDVTLARVASAHAGWAEVAVYGPVGSGSVFTNVMRPVVGLHPAIAAGVRHRLGSRASRLVPAGQLG